MKLDISNICVSISCAILGFYVGAERGITLSFGVVEVIGLVISISMLIVATQALSSWRNQFKHHVQYKSILKVESRFQSYWEAELEVRTACLKNRSIEGFDFSLPMPEINHRNDMQYRYQVSWDELKVYHPKFEKKFSELAPDNLSKGCLTRVMRLYEESYKSSEDDFTQWYHEVHGQALSVFLKQRKKLS